MPTCAHFPQGAWCHFFLRPSQEVPSSSDPSVKGTAVPVTLTGHLSVSAAETPAGGVYLQCTVRITQWYFSGW